MPLVGFEREYNPGTTRHPLVLALIELPRLLLKLEPKRPLKVISGDMSLLKFNKRSKLDSLKLLLYLEYSHTSALPIARRSSCISAVVLKDALPITLNQPVPL